MKRIYTPIWITAAVLSLIALATLSNLRDNTPRAHVIRLLPGQDLKKSLVDFVKKNQITAASIVTGIGSLTDVQLRYANQKNTTHLTGHYEIVSLSGMIASGHNHLHLSVSDGEGKTMGGHLKDGSKIYTTGEIVLMEYPNLIMTREKCPHSGHNELKVEKR